MQIGVDVGGTFTDFSCVSRDGKTLTFKVPSTPNDPSKGVIAGIREIISQTEIAPAEISVFAHGTTVATNAVLERKGANVGLLTTEGFRDVLEIGRQMRTQMYSVRLRPETPIFLAPGARRVGVIERIGSDGNIIKPLDEDSLIRAVKELLLQGVDALAITFLFSFVNPVHELQAQEIISKKWPRLIVSLSSQVDPVFREYERTVVTAFDAYIKPTVDTYLSNLSEAIQKEGVNAPLQVMQSRGGLAGCKTARARPVRLFLSGPAGGVIGSLEEGRTNGFQNLITVDIGGTSCDIALINNSKPLLRQEGVIDTFSVRIPMVDVNAIGSGGGSVAWIDGAGGLKVGPHSAGSEPGPACYDKGGEEPTVTDASLVLGLLDANYFANGRLQLNVQKAHLAIEKYIAQPMQILPDEAASGIHRVLVSKMSEGIRSVSVKQGFDPREFSLMALGGAGPLHACALAEELQITKVLVPRNPGVLSASGLLNAPIEHEVSVSFNKELNGITVEEISKALEKLDVEASQLMNDENADSNKVETTYFADICYIGQGYHLEVDLDLRVQRPLEKLYRDFLVLHDRVYGHSVEAAVRIVNLRSVHQLPVIPPISKLSINKGDCLKGSRQVFVGSEEQRLTVPVFDRSFMQIGSRIEGPVIIEQGDTTTWVPRGWEGRVLETGLLLLNKLESDC